MIIEIIHNLLMENGYHDIDLDVDCISIGRILFITVSENDVYVWKIENDSYYQEYDNWWRFNNSGLSWPNRSLIYTLDMYNSESLSVLIGAVVQHYGKPKLYDYIIKISKKFMKNVRTSR